MTVILRGPRTETAVFDADLLTDSLRLHGAMFNNNNRASGTLFRFFAEYYLLGGGGGRLILQPAIITIFLYIKPTTIKLLFAVLSF